MPRSNIFSKAVGVMAWITRAVVLKDRSHIKKTTSPAELVLAKKILMLASMLPTYSALEKGDLTAFRPVTRGGLVVIAGQIGGDTLQLLLGVEYLPILMPATRLAQLIMWHCHLLDHRRDPSDNLARSRELVWIVRGGRLASQL